MRREARYGSALALLCLAWATLLGSATHGGAERDRPPPAHTGGFGEPLCTACHFQADANTGTGSIIVTGVPAAYTPDSTYTLAISVVQAYLMAGGFQMSARLADGTQAGSLAPAPDDSARAAVTVHDGVQYMHHLYDGTSAVASDTARWHVLWTAPAGGDVIFHIAGNAADDDESPMGDMIYTLSLGTTARR